MLRAIVISLICLSIMFLIFGCNDKPKEKSYIGQTRNEILVLCDRHRYSRNTISSKIIIRLGHGWHDFDAVSEVKANARAMSAPTWGVFFVNGRKDLRSGIYYYELDFKNDKVVSQKIQGTFDAL